MKKVIIFLLLSCSAASAQDKPYRILNSFNSGELSSLLSAREDLTKYQSGCSLMENLFPIPQGGAQKRPGTKYIATAKDSNYPVRLIPFEYSTDQSYIIEVGNEYIRFFTDGATVTGGTGTEDSTDANIIALWTLNDDDDSNTVEDACDTYDGTLTEDNTEDLHGIGKVGTGCFNFSNYDGCAKIDDAAGMTFAETSSPFSIAGWVFVEDTSEVQIIISKWEEGSAREWRLQLLSDETLRLELYDDSLDLDSNCVSQWKLNDNAATTAVDDEQEEQDGVATTNTENLYFSGKIGGAFDFDAQYAVEVDDNDAYSFGDGSTDEPFSVAAWVYYTGVYAGIVAKFDVTTSSEAREWHLIAYANGRAAFQCYDESANAYIERTSSEDSLSTGWNFVAATYDGTSAYTGMNVYIDSVLDNDGGSLSGTYTAMENLATKVTIGAYYGTAGSVEYEWPDKIDNVMIFNKELSLAEIQSLYSSGSGTEDLVGDSVYVTTDSALDAGFRFVAATYDSTGGATAASGITLYVDGSAASSTAHNYSSYVAMEDTAADVRIGAQYSTESEEQYIFANRLDNISIYNKELSAANVASLFTSAVFEIETPYEANEPFEIHYTQSADVLFLTHPDYAPRELSRYAENWWELETIDFWKGPFLDENITDITITPSATTGNITLTASKPLFSPDDVGGLWQITYPAAANEADGTLTAADTNSVTIAVQKGRDYYFVTHGSWYGGTIALQKSYDDGTTWEDVLVHHLEDGGDNVTTSGTEEDDDALYRVYKLTASTTATKYNLTALSFDIEGVVKITSYTNSTTVSAEVKNELGGTSATKRWSEGVWSTKRGYPETVTFFEDRLIFGGNAHKPDTIWGSVVGDYNNMEAGAEDDDAIVFTLSSRQINAIRWMVGKDKLLVGTSGAEWTLGGGTDEPITPSNVKAEQQSTYGSASLQAELANESVLFFQRNAQKMRELAYNWELDSYVAPDMTILAKEVTGDGITDTAFQQIPDSILWCIRDDGEIATFSYERKEQITSWSRQITDGDFESVAVIHGDPEDEVWTSVKRTIDSNDVRYIEQFQSRDFDSDVNDAFFVDCGATYTTDVNVINDLTWLEGETVSVLADGDDIGTFTVSSNTITLGGVYATVQVGLPFTVQLKTMPLSWLGQGTTIQGRIKRINGIAARWYESGDFYFGKDVSHKELQSITGMTTDDSGRLKTFPPGHGSMGYVYIYQYSPEPLTLLALMIEFMVY